MKTNKIYYKNKCKIVENDQGKFIYKIKRKNNEELYKYLENKNFLNFLPQEEHDKREYEIYPYLEDKFLTDEDKAIELIHVLSMLHIKTTTYKEINLDEIKKIYEETKEEINNLRTYYYDLQDYIETKIYMSPAEYLLMKNISKFYKALNYSESKIDKWYQEKSKLKKERLVILHNNLTLDHFLKNENTYLINWDRSEKGPVIFDFLNFYKNEYLNLEMQSLFEIYQTKYQYTSEEKLLFEALISIPPKITFFKTNYINCINAKQKILYVEKTNKFLSKNYEKNQEANNEKFSE